MRHKIIVNFVFLVKFYTTKLKLTKKMMILLALTHECSYIFGRTWYDDVKQRTVRCFWTGSHEKPAEVESVKGDNHTGSETHLSRNLHVCSEFC